MRTKRMKEIVVVNGVTINPGSLSEQYTMDFGNLVSDSSEGFYLFAVNAESKSIVMQGPYESDTSELFLTALKDRRNFPICSLHWGKPFYSTYNIILQSVTAEYNQEGNVSEYGEIVLTVPATYEFLDSNGNIVLAKDLVLIGKDFYATRYEFEGIEGWEYTAIPFNIPDATVRVEKLKGGMYKTLKQINEEDVDKELGL